METDDTVIGLGETAVFLCMDCAATWMLTLEPRATNLPPDRRDEGGLPVRCCPFCGLPRIERLED